MKKLLVIALALMPSLSISVMAQSPGGGPSDPDPECIPVKPQPSPIPNPTPRIAPGDYNDIPIREVPGLSIPGPRSRNSAQVPHCYYQGVVVYIVADTTVTAITASVTRYADNQVWSNTTNSNSLSITASDSPGEYYLELTLSDGLSYQGKYIIE